VIRPRAESRGPLNAHLQVRINAIDGCVNLLSGRGWRIPEASWSVVPERYPLMLGKKESECECYERNYRFAGCPSKYSSEAAVFARSFSNSRFETSGLCQENGESGTWDTVEVDLDRL
jgi:hypothetical protein